jgi:hypothetical protein
MLARRVKNFMSRYAVKLVGTRHVINEADCGFSLIQILQSSVTNTNRCSLAAVDIGYPSGLKLLASCLNPKG